MNSSIALILSMIARLNQEFDRAPPAVKSVVLSCAADCLDMTKPDPELILYAPKEGQNQVDVLVANSHLLCLVPPMFWHRRVRPSVRPASVSTYIRTLERHLKKEPISQAQKQELADWLSAAWIKYPQLREPVNQELGL